MDKSFLAHRTEKKGYPQYLVYDSSQTGWEGARMGRNTGKNSMKKNLLILLHGHSSTGEDLQALGEFWSHLLPDLRFVAPDAPFASETGFGYQWFSLEGINAQNAQQRLEEGRHALQAVLQPILVAEQCDPERDNIILMGFSQGTIMALDCLVTGSLPLAGVIGFSGRLLSAPPFHFARPCSVLLVHGEADTVVPVSDSLEATRQLREAGLAVALITEPDVAHTISQHGLEVASAFLLQQLETNEGLDTQG